MPEQGGIGKTVLGAVAGALAAALVAWLTGILPTVWQWLVTALAWTWVLLSHPVALPLAVVLTLAIPWLVWIVKALRAAAAPAPGSVQGPDPLAGLSDLEIGMLKLLARADGGSVKFANAAQYLETSHLLLERACERLEDLDLIHHERDLLHGSMFRLTRYGRDLVIERGFQLGWQEGANHWTPHRGT